MRLSEASETFLSVRAQEGFSRYTINAYRLQHELLVRDIGDLDIEDVTLQILRDHLNHHGHLKPTSVGHKIQAIKSLFNWLVEEELLLRNPTLKLNEPKRGQRVPKALTIEELEFPRDSCRNALEHALIEFFFASGCRVAEIQRLNRNDIDWQRARSDWGKATRSVRFTSGQSLASGCSVISMKEATMIAPCS